MSIGLKKSAFQNRDSSKKKKNARYKTLKKSKKPRKSIVNPKMEIAFDKTSFNYWRLQLDSLVKQDLLKKWFGENNRKKITAVPSRTFLPFLISQAEHHIWESIHDRDVVHSILLSSLYSYKKTFWLYKFTIHWAVQAVVFISIFLVHLPLSFFKYSSVSDWETHEVPFVVKVIEGVVIFIEIFKASLDASVLYVLLKSHQDSISHFFLLHPLNSKATEDEDLSRSVGELLHLKFNKGLKRLSLLLTILFIVLIDWLLLFFNIWTIEFYFPIRVIIVLLMNYSVRHVFVSFLKTLRRAKDEFVLYFSSVLFVAVTGNILLTGNSTSLGNTFANIVRSFTSSFVFFSTGENFVDVVYSNGPINVAYFIFVTIMGTFIVMAFVLSSFVRSFHKEFQKEVIKKKQNSRTGLFAAFSLLDLDHTGRISPIVLDEVFTYFTRKPDPDMLVQTPSILGHIDERKKSHRLKAFLTKGSRLETFVDVMEDLLDEEEMNRYIEKIGQVHNVGYDQIVSAQASNSKNCEEISSSGLIELAQNGDQSSRRLDSQVSLSNLTQTSMPSRNLSDLGENDINQSRGKKRFRMNKNSFKDVQGNIRHTLFVFLCRPAVVNFITFLVLIQTGLLCCYGLLDSRQTFFLDVANTFFIFLFFIEISLKLYAYGPTAYWSPTLYIFKDHENLNGPEHEIANRMDIFSISACIIFFLLSIIVNYEGISGRLWRFGVSFVVLRVFSQVSSTRRLIYPIFMPGVVRQFANLFVLLLLVIYVFAIYGMLLFRDVFDPSVLGASVPEGNFDSLANSMYVLFQLLVGESWHAVMYATIRMIGFSYSWYFIVYTIIVTLLFTNIFVSLILTTMERFGGRYDLTKRDFERLLLVGAEQDRDSNSKY